MAERTDFTAYCIFSTINTLTYCVPAGWVWGGHGFLGAMGFVDFAGSSAVHLLGGVAACVSTVILGPRLRRYEAPDPPAGNPVNVIVGNYILWWGWLGFNCGSTFGISGDKWLLAGRAAITTINASFAGGITGVAWGLFGESKQFDISLIINGILGALVAITAGCAYVEPWEALIIGTIGAMIASGMVPILNRFHIDDPVGAIAVHGGAGLWGTLAVGLFAETDNLNGVFKGGGFKFLGVQALGCVTISVWSAVTTFLMLHIISIIRPIRMPAWVEVLGADLVDHGIRHDHYDDYDARIEALLDRGFSMHGHDWVTDVHPWLERRKNLKLWAQRQMNTKSGRHRRMSIDEDLYTTHFIKRKKSAFLSARKEEKFGESKQAWTGDEGGRRESRNRVQFRTIDSASPSDVHMMQLPGTPDNIH